jgi:predicted amidohydrolase
MPTIRIAVASTPLTATLDEAVPAAITALEDAGRLGAAVVCLPETVLPGHRLQARAVPDYSAGELEEAVATVAAAAARAGVAAIVGAERPVAHGREIVAHVIAADGARVGIQAKTQVALEEDELYVPGSGRRLFTVQGLRFAVAICHEAFRYPEISRSAALGGAQVVFVPHYVTTEDGALPARWLDAPTPYNEKSLLLRALENTIYVAPANTAGPDQGSATCVIAPDGTLLTQVPYGEVGVAAVEIDLALADATIARRWSPERSCLEAPA